MPAFDYAVLIKLTKLDDLTATNGSAMYTIEFEADIQNGVIKIPTEYSSLKNRHARVVILLDDTSNNNENQQTTGSFNAAELRAISDHSANLVQEWHELSEDDVWKNCRSD